MSERPLVSVVIPAFNASAFILEAVHSVLGQTARSIECIVVDDGSTDDTSAKAAVYGDSIRLISQTNRGVSAARNLGAEIARGEFIAFLDADDIWRPTKIARQIELFEEDSTLGLAYTGMDVVDESRRFIEYVPAPHPSSALRNTLFIEGPSISIAQTGLMPKAAFDQAGAFDVALSTSADADLACRLALAFPIAAIDEPLVLYRRHGGQMHLNPTLTERDMQRVFDKIFGDPRLDPDLRGRRRRAEANLYYVLGATAALHHSYGRGARYLGRAFRREPRRTAGRLRTRAFTKPAGEADTRGAWLEEAATHTGWEQAYRTDEAAAFYDAAFDWLSESFGCDSVLDLGCGTGAHAIRLARRGFDVLGVDVSDVALDRARAKIEEAGLGDRVRLRQADLLSLPLPEGSADCVLSWGVLMHVPALERAVASISRILAPGGVLVLSEVNSRAPEALVIRLANRIRGRGRLTRTPFGYELARSDAGAAAFTRHSDIPALIGLLEERGFRLIVRRAGQLTELYGRLPGARARRFVHALNARWFRGIGLPQLAVGNILVFRKAD